MGSWSGLGRRALGVRITVGIVMAVMAGTVVVDVGPAGASVASKQTGASTDWGASAASPCDGLDASLCALPFPNDYYTAADAALPTGRRIDLPAGAFPVSANAVPPSAPGRGVR